MQPINRTMGAVEWMLLILLSILWGGSFFFIGVAVEGLPPFTLVAIRVVIAAACLLILLRVLGIHMPRERHIWLAFFGMGFLNNVIPFSLIVWGQTHIASGLASILNGTTPFFAVVVAHYFTQDEKLTTGRLIGVLIGFVGVVAMIGPSALDGFGTNILAQLAILGAAVSYSFAGVFGRRFKTLGVPPLATATGQITTATIMLIPVALLVDQPWQLPAPSGTVWAAVIALAIVSTALAYVIYFRILETAGATNLMLVTFLIPVSAILLGTAFLDEQLAGRHFLGMALLGLGLAAIDGRIPAYFMRRA